MAVDEVIRGGLVICRPMPVLFEEFGQTLGHTKMSDLHIGAVNTDYDLISQEIQTAKDKGDRVCINGDVFDFILPSDRKRFTTDALHPRLYGKKDIVNAVIPWAVEIFAPIVDQIDGIGCGNHETSMEKYHSLDPIKALIYELEKLRTNKRHVIHHMGYTGFLDYRYRYQSKVQRAKTNSNSYRLSMFYHHGGGGAAPVTKGMIDFNRKDTYVDADVIWLGHKHNRFTSHVRKLSCPDHGDQPKIRDVRHIMTGAYFDTYVGQSQESIKKDGRRASWAADAGFSPQGKGGARLEVRPMTQGGGLDLKVIQ